MSNIKKAFANGKAFIAFVTCGDPNLATTFAAVRAAVENGADLVELGVPFSDPVAEGPTIQAANVRALKGGVTTEKVFELVKELRTDITVPLVLMTYANVPFSYGSERFIKRCREVGVDGLIVPDLPFEEKDEFLPYCRQTGVDLISMIAPSSNERIAKIAEDADGFIYIVSNQGVTGVREKIETDIVPIVEEARAHSDAPCAVGFGVATPEQAREFADIADGVIVGSAIVKLMEKYGEDAPKYVGEFVRTMKDALK